MTVPPTARRIAEAARTILVNEGAAAVTMRRVADVVGLSPMATYKHYPSRQVLLDTVADDAFRELTASWGTRVPDGSWEDRTLGLMHDFLDFALGRPHLYRFLMTDRRERARRFPDDFAGRGAPPFSLLVVLVGEGMRAGPLREDDPLEVTLALTSSVQGLVELYLGGRIGLDEAGFRGLCERTVRRILHGIGA
ncbi:TetR/AcrR family transcriptional regulator [Nonomuraea jiangxiensis]|uniref:DNA-binding transcriptional regulator, AcrR family n=1 Tax=Nonomuraea jiangxiensis TaxID=633440 RepID=A0A1G8DE85_9ACTN|nr:TetR/AcrR family transcriptional regulator [Nonomuraea jiangxiensis]SDH55933.1 DNA-binding transcriptional regulator, AcrR family [Nonomuraea jiangxiensis]